MIALSFAIAAIVLATIPALMILKNASLYRAPSAPQAASAVRASILIPARNEEKSIEASVHAALSTTDISFELIVLDDASTDRTTEIVSAIARSDSRLRLEAATALPSGWCGKQHACFELSERSTGEWLVFIDADVRLSSDAVSRAVQFAIEAGSPLVSGFPQEETGTLLERLLIPLIHFVLLGFLPLEQMRKSTSPAFGAGCGQFFIARRDAYEAVGGHSAIRASLHDGITLPRAFRASGFRTDLFDATALATCRMYRSAGEVWNGLAKNATEGMASPVAIVPWTLMLGIGQVVPLVLLLAAVFDRAMPHRPIVLTTCAVSCVMSLAIRLFMAKRFRQSMVGAMLHPIGVALLLMIQWYALSRKLLGASAVWKGRQY